MHKTNRKPLALKRSTVRPMTGSELEGAHGGAFTVSTILTQRTYFGCQPQTITTIRTTTRSQLGCPSDFCNGGL